MEMRLADLRERLPDMRRGAWRYFMLGVIFAILAVASRHGKWPDTRQVSVAGWVMWFLLGGPSVGVIGGFLRPLGDRWVGAALLGVVGVIPICVAVDFFRSSNSPGDPANVMYTALACLLVGSFVGTGALFERRRNARLRKPDRDGIAKGTSGTQY
jgi:peptidoglycan/LPS O-acetylase OafA/YrhL